METSDSVHAQLLEQHKAEKKRIRRREDYRRQQAQTVKTYCKSKQRPQPAYDLDEEPS